MPKSLAEIQKELAAPFAPEAVSWRVGKISKKDPGNAMALAYIDARDVMDRLDAVLGIGDWQCRYTTATKDKTVCEIGLLVPRDVGFAPPFEWIWKADGAGDTDIEGEKGSLSDAFKRSAVRFGIARYLYGEAFKNVWVKIDPTYKQILDNEYPRLEAILRGKKPPAAQAPTPAPTTQAPQAAPTKKTLEIRAKDFIAAIKKADNATDIERVVALGGDLLNELQATRPLLYAETEIAVKDRRKAVGNA